MRKTVVLKELLWLVISTVIAGVLTWWLKTYLENPKFDLPGGYPSLKIVFFGFFFQCVFLIWMIRVILKRFSVIVMNAILVISNIALFYCLGPFFNSIILIRELAQIQKQENDAPVQGLFYGGSNVGSLWINYSGFDPVTFVLILFLAFTCFMIGFKARKPLFSDHLG